MGNLKLEAVNGIPLGDSGILAPIFVNEAGGYFQAGDTRNRSFGRDRLEETFGYKSAFTVRTLSLDAKEYTEEKMRVREKEIFRYFLPSCIVYISRALSKFFGGDEALWRIAKRHGGRIVTPADTDSEEYRLFNYFLFNRSDQVSFAAGILNLATKAMDDELPARIMNTNQSDTVITGQDDPLDRLAQLMLNLANADNLYEALRYKSFAILFGPNSKNFRIWLKGFLNSHDIPPNLVPKSSDHWIDAAIGVYDKARIQIIRQKASALDRKAQYFGSAAQREIILRNSIDSMIARFTQGTQFSNVQSVAYERPEPITQYIIGEFNRPSTREVLGLTEILSSISGVESESSTRH